MRSTLFLAAMALAANAAFAPTVGAQSSPAAVPARPAPTDPRKAVKLPPETQKPRPNASGKSADQDAAAAQQLKMQLYMDRQSKSDQATSNLRKKMSDTSSAITSNGK